ncbi:hypothetical protein AWC22_23175 [Mycobacterium riyadhense]|uniref:Uncharacterized protein n=1 Tax=Mycobacterium riyadhense TaxID=486698 RepID=A0A1X2CF88_9MYCO|nr:hypothetical protein AWC22_23175 [Mycobacterium riyadhense]
MLAIENGCHEGNRSLSIGRSMMSVYPPLCELRRDRRVGSGALTRGRPMPSATATSSATVLADLYSEPAQIVGAAVEHHLGAFDA